MLDRHVQPQLVLSEGQDNLIFLPPPPEPLSLSREIVNRLKEDLGLAILSYGFSQAARWMLIGRFDISSRVPEFVLIAAFVMSVSTTIFERLSKLFRLPSEFSIIENISILVTSIAVTASIAKICHIPVSSTQGTLFLIVVLPTSLFVYQVFEE